MSTQGQPWTRTFLSFLNTPPRLPAGQTYLEAEGPRAQSRGAGRSEAPGGVCAPVCRAGWSAWADQLRQKSWGRGEPRAWVLALAGELGRQWVGSSMVMWAICLWDYDWQGLPGRGVGWTGRLAHWAGLLRGSDRTPDGRKRTSHNLWWQSC